MLCQVYTFSLYVNLLFLTLGFKGKPNAMMMWVLISLFFFLTVDFPFHRFKARCFFFTQRVTVLKKIWQTYGYITMSQGELEVGSVCLLLTPTLAMQFTADFKLGQWVVFVFEKKIRKLPFIIPYSYMKVGETKKGEMLFLALVHECLPIRSPQDLCFGVR